MADDEFIPLEIVMQGAPVVGSDKALVWARADNILCLDIDLDSKHCALAGEGGHDGYGEVYINEREDTIHPEEGPGGKGLTGIRFPPLQGWDVYNASLSRYTLRVTLVKAKPQ